MRGCNARASLTVASVELRFFAGAELQSTNHVLARYHAKQPLIAFDHRYASDAMIDHELKHPRQLGFPPDIDEFRRHDFGDGSIHQFVVARYHVRQRKNEAGQKVELCHQADNPRFLLNRVGIEVVFFEQTSEFPQRGIPRYGLGVPRHGVGCRLFEEPVQGANPVDLNKLRTQQLLGFREDRLDQGQSTGISVTVANSGLRG
jgi:hypothetical protein